MNKSIAAATLAASVVTGGLAGSMFAPGIAGAVSTSASTAATGAVGWVDDALGGLVDDGTITRDQADAVETALADARPERGHGFRHLPGLEAATEVLGLSAEEVRAALGEGQTLAEVAEEQGVAVEDLVNGEEPLWRGGPGHHHGPRGGADPEADADG